MRVDGLGPTSDSEQFGVYCHAHDRICTELFESVDLLLGSDAAGDDELAGGEFSQPRGDIKGKALQQALAGKEGGGPCV